MTISDDKITEIRDLAAFNAPDTNTDLRAAIGDLIDAALEAERERIANAIETSRDSLSLGPYSTGVALGMNLAAVLVRDSHQGQP